MDIKLRFGKRLHDLRIERGLSQEAVANLADIDRTYIQSIEKGKRNVSISILEKLSITLEISLSELLKEI
ncbi:helix-turn-helix domain-containing protein [Cellulophaga sp. E6(2014)]|uniref:helix-turn-helix domain-containing protein n=1 Tax=Cellulophaga sp. E6(2014) TaxID=1495334 RepID=UPI00051D66E8|nr:helix-turn-helix transcriptional regulator [Cellulophaga sp. E6(2014)]KGK30777.1 hypothetical protein EL45_07595 [Cellulophaga sp. E6(2014)]